MGEVEKNSFVALPGKGPSRLLPPKLCVPEVEPGPSLRAAPMLGCIPSLPGPAAVASALWNPGQARRLTVPRSPSGPCVVPAPDAVGSSWGVSSWLFKWCPPTAGTPQDHTPPSRVSLRGLGQPFFFLISWRLITLQYCSGFCHTLT